MPAVLWWCDRGKGRIFAENSSGGRTRCVYRPKAAIAARSLEYLCKRKAQGECSGAEPAYPNGRLNGLFVIDHGFTETPPPLWGGRASAHSTGHWYYSL